MNGGEIVAKVLKEQHVKFLFTLCGGHISPILVSARQAGIRVIDTRHEANAVFAADAVSRLTGVTGVAAVTAGPGITNTISAIHNALIAQSPLVLLGGAAPTLLKGRGALQDIDQIPLMRPSVKWAVAVRTKKQIYPTLKRAFELAQEGVPGPVFVELPVDLLYEESLVREWYVKAASSRASLVDRMTSWYINRHVEKMFSGEALPDYTPRKKELPRYTKSDLSKVISLLSAGQQPVLLIGSGAMMQPTQAGQFAESISALGIPVYLSGMARGLLGNNNPLQFRHHRKEALREADLIILAGVPCDFRLDYGRHINKKANIISLNRSQGDLKKNRKPTLGLHVDPMNFLIALGQSAALLPVDRWKNWKSKLCVLEQEREQSITLDAERAGVGINPVKLFLELDHSLPSNAIIIADGGDFVGTAAYTLKPRRPLSWLDPGAFGTLGIGGGFALAAALCFPDSEVYVLYGDGSSAYSLMEFDTFTRHGLPVIAIIGNDACWSQIARDQVEILNDDCGTILASSQYELVAQAFGANGKKVHTMGEFRQALAEAQASSRQGVSYLINAVLAKSEFRKGSLSM